MTEITIQIKGIEDITRKFKGMPPALRQGLARAGRRYAPVMLEQQGVKIYPPLTAGNAPPTPYYVRGTGTQYASYNDNRSEQYGTRFTIETPDAKTVISNTASYAKYLAGEFSQARRMAGIGWKKLIDAAKNTRTQMMNIYTEEVANVLRIVGLK